MMNIPVFHKKNLTEEEKAIVKQVVASTKYEIDGYEIEYHDMPVDIIVERSPDKDLNKPYAEAVVGLKLEAYERGYNAIINLGFFTT